MPDARGVLHVLSEGGGDVKRLLCLLRLGNFGWGRCRSELQRLRLLRRRFLQEVHRSPKKLSVDVKWRRFVDFPGGWPKKGTVEATSKNLEL